MQQQQKQRKPLKAMCNMRLSPSRGAWRDTGTTVATLLALKAVKQVLSPEKQAAGLGRLIIRPKRRPAAAQAEPAKQAVLGEANSGSSSSEEEPVEALKLLQAYGNTPPSSTSQPKTRSRVSAGSQTCQHGSSQNLDNPILPILADSSMDEAEPSSCHPAHVHLPASTAPSLTCSPEVQAAAARCLPATGAQPPAQLEPATRSDGLHSSESSALPEEPATQGGSGMLVQQVVQQAQEINARSALLAEVGFMQQMQMQQVQMQMQQVQMQQLLASCSQNMQITMPQQQLMHMQQPGQGLNFSDFSLGAAAAPTPALAAALQDPAAGAAVTSLPGWQPLPAASNPAEQEAQLDGLLFESGLEPAWHAQLNALLADSLVPVLDPQQHAGLVDGQTRVATELEDLLNEI